MTLVLVVPAPASTADNVGPATDFAVEITRAAGRESFAGNPAAADGKAAPRPAHQVGHGRTLHRQGRRLSSRSSTSTAANAPTSCFRRASSTRASNPPRRHDHAHADGPRLSRPRPAFEILRPGHASRWSRWCRTPAAGTTPSRSPAPPNITTTSAIPAMINCSENFNGALADKGVTPRAGLDGDQLLLQHRRSTRMASWSSPTSPGRGRATMC